MVKYKRSRCEPLLVHSYSCSLTAINTSAEGSISSKITAEQLRAVAAEYNISTSVLLEQIRAIGKLQVFLSHREHVDLIFLILI